MLARENQILSSHTHAKSAQEKLNKSNHPETTNKSTVHKMHVNYDSRKFRKNIEWWYDEKTDLFYKILLSAAVLIMQCNTIIISLYEIIFKINQIQDF